MKKLLSVCLALAMLASLLTACGGKASEETTAPTAAAALEGTMEDLLNRVIAERPVEFAGGVTTLNLADTSEDGQWALKSYTGLEDASRITEAAVLEPMIGSIAFSMVMVRVAPGEDSKTVAEDMKAGIDPAKWICVSADDVMAAGYADVVMLIMLSSSLDMTAQSFVDAFQTVAGGELKFVI